MPRILAPPALGLAAALSLLGACATVADPLEALAPLPEAPPALATGAISRGGGPLALTPVESRYIADTARAIYRGRPVERTRGFVFADERGFGICTRSVVKGAFDHSLLILQRRITEDFVSQVADDVVILRSRADVAPCRALPDYETAWVPAGRT